MAAADGKASVTLSKIVTDQQFYTEIAKPGLTILDVYCKWAGPCEAMQPIFKKLSNGNTEVLRYQLAQSDDIQALHKFKNKSLPTFLFFANGVLVNVIQGANAPLIEKFVKESCETIKAGGPIQAYTGQDVVIPTAANSGDASAFVSQQSSPKVEDYTLAIIKPDAVQHYSEIKEAIHQSMFQILREKKFVFTKELASIFYQEHAQKNFFPNLISYITSGPVIAFQLARENAFKTWRDLIGPANSKRAKEEYPQTLRALFGIDGQRNAVHGSDSQPSAIREAGLIFTDSVPAVMESRSQRLKSDAEKQSTLVLLHPELVKAYKLPDPLGADSPNPVYQFSTSVNETTAVEMIVQEIQNHGLEIVKAQMSTLTADQAQVLFGESEIAKNAISGPAIALLVQGDLAIDEICELVGPKSPAAAKESAPKSLRALYGEDDVKIGIHTSASVQDAFKEVDLFFPYSRAASAKHRKSSALQKHQKTVAMIKPDAVLAGRVDAIISRIQDCGFTIVRKEQIALTEDKVRAFYKNVIDKPFFKDLLAFMLSGPVVVMTLEKDNAILAWRELIGPADSDKAREVAPNSLRALYGTDAKQNAVYGSDSEISAMQDISVFFGLDENPNLGDSPSGLRKSLENMKESLKNVASDIKSSLKNVMPEGRSSNGKLDDKAKANDEPKLSRPELAFIKSLSRNNMSKSKESLKKGSSNSALSRPVSGAKTGSKSNLLGSKSNVSASVTEISKKPPSASGARVTSASSKASLLKKPTTAEGTS